MLERFLLEHEATLRLSLFAGLLALFTLLEALAPRRDRSLGRARRWGTNGGLALLGAAFTRALTPIGAVAAAHFAAERGWGLLPRLDPDPALAFIASVIALDLAVWAQHVATHRVPLLWRLHRVHHFDLDLDASSGVRFHPLEIAFSILWKSAVVVALGAGAAAVIAFEVLLNASALFSHANLRLPLGLDRALRTILVTPDMHRGHHSTMPAETNSNYGFALSVWDRLFRTYRDAPALGHDAMQIGLEQERDPERAERLTWLLVPSLRFSSSCDKRRR